MPAEQDGDRSGLPASEKPQPAASSQTASFEEGLTALGDLVARLHNDGRVEATEHTEHGTRVKARVPAALAAGLIVDVEVERKRLAVALGGPSVEDLQARIRELEALAAKPEAAAQKAAGKAKG